MAGLTRVGTAIVLVLCYSAAIETAQTATAQVWTATVPVLPLL